MIPLDTKRRFARERVRPSGRAFQTCHAGRASLRFMLEGALSTGSHGSAFRPGSAVPITIITMPVITSTVVAVVIVTPSVIAAAIIAVVIPVPPVRSVKSPIKGNSRRITVVGIGVAIARSVKNRDWNRWNGKSKHEINAGPRGRFREDRQSSYRKNKDNELLHRIIKKDAGSVARIQEIVRIDSK
jgi:hypothetical protein